MPPAASTWLSRRSGIQVHRGREIPDDPAATIIVLVTRDATMLMRCLESLDLHLPRHDQHELIIVGNGTPPAALTPVERRDDTVLIRSPVNHGFSGGCNLAVRFARAQRLVFLNDDVVIRDQDWLSGLHSALDRDQSVAVAGSRVVLEDGRLQEVGSVLWSDGSTSGVGRGRDPLTPGLTTSRKVDYVSFCSAMVRRSAWEEVGGFDERFFPAYYEDLDLCLTLEQTGWSSVCVPESTVVHQEGASASRQFRDFLSRRNQVIFRAKWGDVLNQYEPAPARESERCASVQRALARCARRSVASHPALATPHGPDARPSMPSPPEEGEVLTTQLRHLAALTAVQAEYIAGLERDARAPGMLALVIRRVNPWRTRFRQGMRGARATFRVGRR